MKTFKRILLAMIPALLFVSCGETNPDDPDNGGNGGDGGKDKTVIRVVEALPLYELAADKDTALISFSVTLDEKDADWTISTSADWCKAEPASGTGLGEVNIIVADNPTANERKADIVIKSGKKEQTLKVSQSLYAGALPDEPWFSKSYIERTDREKAGFRGPVKSWCEVTYTTYHKYFYDEAGHLVKEEYHDTSNNSVEVRWVHTYDAQGRRIKSEQSYGSEVQGGRVFTYEYNNPGKLVATNAFNWIEYEDGWINGKDFPMSVWKDLSAIHYVDDSPGYYERSDIAFEFQSDGSLTMTETYNRERDGSNPNVSVYHIVYENGLPVSCPESKVAVTYDAKGLPATLSTEDGAKTWTFLGHTRVLLAATMKEPKAQGLVACFWANYSYNSNGDKTRFERAYFSADQVYNDYFGKYFYDSYGNWIQRNETTEPAFQHGQHFTDTINREIEYY